MRTGFHCTALGGSRRRRPLCGFAPQITQRLVCAWGTFIKAADRLNEWFDELTDIGSPFYGWAAITLGLLTTVILLLDLARRLT